MRFVSSNASFSLMLFYTWQKPGLKPHFAGSMWPAKVFREARDQRQRRCGNAPKNLPILKQLQIYFKTKHEKGVGTTFSRVPASLHSCPRYCWGIFK